MDSVSSSGTNNSPTHTSLILQEFGYDPGNFYQELEMDSPYVDTHQDVTHSNANIQLHSHNFYELICCRNNCNAEYIIGSERYKLRKGDIIFIPPDTSHRPLLPEVVTEPYIRDVLWISEIFMKSICVNFPGMEPDRFSKPGLLRTAGTRLDYICELFRHGVQEAESRQPCWETIVCANCAAILAHLSRTSMDGRTYPLSAEKPDLIDQVMAYVELHLSERLTLPDVARQFFVSESTVSQSFRKKMNVSFYRFVTQRRLISAKSMIEEGMPMETVAESVGFSDYSSFFRAFKQEYGISPRAYRKLQNNGY